ncbi:MAG: T9SS type A sorting domain-containing protein [Bacteroidia bacterium]|nr:T9SS type A sorting domain-containing protein [Bacteroidia bacterium]
MKKTLLFAVAILLGAISSSSYAAEVKKDSAVYANRSGYKLESKWMYSAVLNNYNSAPDKLGAAGAVRGLTAKDGKMYFCSRTTVNQILVVDGATGALLAPINLASNVFTYLGRNKANTADSTYLAPLPNNDIQKDNAGNILVSNLTTSNAGRFQVWKIDLATGAGTVLINTDIITHYPLSKTGTRFDAIGVWGDVNGNAVIMAANAEATVTEVYKWTITGGVVNQKPTLIELDNSGQYWFGAYTAGTNSFAPLANLGSAPRVLPLDDTFFYVDGNTTFPTLCDQDGNVIDGFFKIYNPDGTTLDATAYGLLTDNITDPANTWVMNQGHNGVKEFQIGSDYFLIMAASNTAAKPFSSFRMFKFKDALKLFEEMTLMWTFPQAGMGAVSNTVRTGMPEVEVTGNSANIYLYTHENGYGAYTMTIATGVNNINASNVDIILRGRQIVISEQVKTAEIYSVNGQLLATANNINEMAAPGQKGIYIVRVTDNSGAQKVQKIAVQ